MPELYGAAVSLDGYDVKNAADFEKVFDSNFPNLKIHSQGSFTTSSSISSQTIKTHNLGYPPFFLVYVIDLNGSYLASSGFSQYFRINGTDLIYDGGFGGSIKIYYYIFFEDMELTILPTSVETNPTTAGGSSGYGFKISKAGHDVKTASGKDLIMSSEYRTPIVHQASSATYSGASDVTINHGLGYYPMFFVYLKDVFSDGRYQILNNSSQTYIYATTSNVVFNYNVSGSYRYSCLIIKDPIQT